MGVTRAVMQMKAQSLSPREIRAEIDQTYASAMAGATPTPYPPA